MTTTGDHLKLLNGHTYICNGRSVQLCRVIISNRSDKRGYRNIIPHDEWAQEHTFNPWNIEGQ